MSFSKEAWNLAINDNSNLFLIQDLESQQQHRLYNMERIKSIVNDLEREKMEYNNITRNSPVTSMVNYSFEIQQCKDAYDFLLRTYNTFNLML